MTVVRFAALVNFTSSTELMIVWSTRRAAQRPRTPTKVLPARMRHQPKGQGQLIRILRMPAGSFQITRGAVVTNSEFLYSTKAGA